MADRPGLAEAWSRAMEANARYYETWGRLTSSWLRELADVSSGLRLPRVVTVRTEPAAHRSPSAPSPAEASAAAQPAQAAALVLEASGGQQASGAFLVENTLGRHVQQPVEAGPFTDASGAETAFALTLEPATIDLAPGDQVVVRATVVVPETLDGERRGTVRVAGVPGAEIPLVIRRVPE
jgi:hypothetical protein